MSLPRAVVALGGNARGEPLEAASQAHAARDTARLLGQASLTHQLVITHGNGPQVEAVCGFVEHTGGRVIGSLGQVRELLDGRAGTQVVAEGPGIECAARGAARARAS